MSKTAANKLKELLRELDSVGRENGSKRNLKDIVADVKAARKAAKGGKS